MDIFEEIRDLELNEDLPKDLAKAFKNSFERPRDAEYGKHEMGYGNILAKGGSSYRPLVDFKNSTYTEISPEEALKLYKSGNSRNVYAIFNGNKLANTYLNIDPSTGAKSRKYDFKAVANGLEKKNGNRVENTMQLSPEEFYNNATKIYVANEVGVDQGKRDKRAENPESEYNNPAVKQPTPKPILKNNNNINMRRIDIRNGLGKYDSRYVDNAVVNFDGSNMTLNSRQYYPLEVWQQVYSDFRNRWSEDDSDVQSVKYIIDELSGVNRKNGPMAYDWRQYNRAKNYKANVRYKDVENTLQKVINSGRETLNRISAAKRDLDRTISAKGSQTSSAEVEAKKARIKRNIDEKKYYINYYMKMLLQLQDQLDDVDINNDKLIADFDKKIADINDKIAGYQQEMKDLIGSNFGKKAATEELKEDLNVITLTREDQASNIRSLIKTCWDNVDAYSMYAAQLNEFGSQQALEVVNNLINDLYIAIGAFEGVLGEVDLKSAAIDAPEQIEAVVQVAPQVVQQMAQPAVAPMMIEKFVLPEEDVLTEELDEKPEAQEELEKPVEKELKEVEKYRKEKVKDSLNPEQEKKETSNMEVDLDEGLDETYDPRFFESLLKLEED